MAHQLSTNMNPPKPKKPLKRKNQLRISQPIHHQQNINTNNNNSSDRFHSPYRKKPRYSSPRSSSINTNKIPKKKQHERLEKPKSLSRSRPTHIFSSISPLESEKDILLSLKDETVINFSCISYDSLVQYCKMFKLHHFQYNYHYDLAQSQSNNNNNTDNNNNNDDIDIDILMDFKQKENENKNLSARISKREMDDDEEPNVDVVDNKNKKRNRKNKNKNRKRVDAEHHYFNSDSLDTHYEKQKRQQIPHTFERSTRLTKSELVEIVRQHFLSAPLLKDLNEIDVIKQFLLFIQNRRNKLKQEFCFQR